MLSACRCLTALYLHDFLLFIISTRESAHQFRLPLTNTRNITYAYIYLLPICIKTFGVVKYSFDWIIFGALLHCEKEMWLAKCRRCVMMNHKKFALNKQAQLESFSV